LPHIQTNVEHIQMKCADIQTKLPHIQAKLPHIQINVEHIQTKCPLNTAKSSIYITESYTIMVKCSVRITKSGVRLM